MTKSTKISKQIVEKTKTSLSERSIVRNKIPILGKIIEADSRRLIISRMQKTPISILNAKSNSAFQTHV